jgi:hypothetical protein
MVLNHKAMPHDWRSSGSYYRQWTRKDWERIEPKRYHRVFTDKQNGLDPAANRVSPDNPYINDWEITKICSDEYVLVNRGQSIKISMLFHPILCDILVWNVENLL